MKGYLLFSECYPKLNRTTRCKLIQAWLVSVNTHLCIMFKTHGLEREWNRFQMFLDACVIMHMINLPKIQSHLQIKGMNADHATHIWISSHKRQKRNLKSNKNSPISCDIFVPIHKAPFNFVILTSIKKPQKEKAFCLEQQGYKGKEHREFIRNELY